MNSFRSTLVDGVLSGPIRYARNLSIDATGSIHHDNTAKEIGFRGGTVAADIHLDQFAPLLVEVFGHEWFETGSLSLFFKFATIDGEAGVASVAQPTARTNTQVNVWMKTPEGVVVCEGTASVGAPAAPTSLHTRDLRLCDSNALRLLRGVNPGDPLTTLSLSPRAHEQQERIRHGLVTEPLDWYTGESPWGQSIASPLTTAQLLHWEPVQALAASLPPAIGMFGAMEIRYVHGPMFNDSEYTVTGQVVGVSDSPKTEVLWYDTQAADANGRIIATCRVMSRLVKASSPLFDSSAS
jgi:hypothetical protein